MKWIAVTDRLPSKSHNYFVKVWSERHQYTYNDCNHFDKGSFAPLSDSKSSVSHWLDESESPSPVEVEAAAKEYANEKWGADDWRFESHRNNAVKDFIAGYNFRANHLGEDREGQVMPIDENEEIELFKRHWYARNPVHEMTDGGRNLFWKTAMMVAKEFTMPDIKKAFSEGYESATHHEEYAKAWKNFKNDHLIKKQP